MTAVKISINVRTTKGPVLNGITRNGSSQYLMPNMKNRTALKAKNRSSPLIPSR